MITYDHENDEAAQYYKKTCELIKKNDSDVKKDLQEACDMYELLK